MFVLVGYKKESTMNNSPQSSPDKKRRGQAQERKGKIKL
jgi:hypothetical protein